jgi:Tat protein secretion system quality control protein TatD with DNase activity
MTPLTKREEQLLELIHDMFRQACWTKGGYNHQFISTYEDAQELLVQEGFISISSCVYKEDGLEIKKSDHNEPTEDEMMGFRTSV